MQGLPEWRHVAVENTITNDYFPHEDITDVFESGYKDILFDARSEMFATERLKHKISKWQTGEDPSVVVFTSGVYDLLHHDHKGYLLHTKLTGLPILYESQEAKAWNKLGERQQLAFAMHSLLSDKLKLVVSVDGDQSVADRKGSDSSKGSAPRPITGWETRAKSVADVTVPISSGKNGTVRKPVADAVTVHGPLDFHDGHPSSTLFTLAALLQPDVWAIYGESQDILDEAPYIKSLGAISLRCIPYRPGVTYFSDSIIGRFSTSSIVKRVLGE